MAELITTAEAARIMSRTKRTLQHWRDHGIGPQPVTRIGVSYLYDKAECETYAKQLAAVGRLWERPS